MKRLFLDDYRQPIDCFVYTKDKIYYEDWVVVKNYPEFVKYISENGIPDIISFDHDLADGHYHQNLQEGKLNYYTEDFIDDYNKTGYHCAKWLIDYCLDNNLILSQYLVHSMNPVGKENIDGLLKSFIKFQNDNTL